jgi:pyruvate dehydrogenase E1 component beta subunit
MSLVAAAGFELLDAPPALVAPPLTPVPFAPELEDAYLPAADSVREGLEELLAY